MQRAARAEAERQIAEERRAAEGLRATLMPRLRAAVERLRDDGVVRRLWVFGSYAWGLPTESSDLDVLIESDRDALDVASALALQLGLQVHAVDRARAPQSLVDRALADGVEI